MLMSLQVDFQFSKSEPRKIHIWDFPHDFFVKLEPDMAKELVNRAAEMVGGIKKLARILKRSHPTVYQYRASTIFTPLASLLKLCDLANVAIELVESYIVAYKGEKNAEPIWNPQIPLIETPDLFGLMGHLTGDGGHNKYRAYYSNTNETLVRKFLRQLNDVFGEVSVDIVVAYPKRKENWKDITSIRFGMTIVRLLWHLYHVDFRTFTARVPQCLFELSREYVGAYLRAFGDDEGSVDDTSICLCSANRELLWGIYELVQEKFPELGAFIIFKTQKRNSHPNWTDTYFIRFRTGAFETFRTLIGFTHPKKKQELDQILARRERSRRRRNPGAIHRMLLNALKLGAMTTKKLARRLNVTTETIRLYLKRLIAWGCVRESDPSLKQRRLKVFELTEFGRKFLKLPFLDRHGRSQLAILTTLAEGRLTVDELRQKLNLTIAPIQRHLMGRRTREGRWYAGVFELGLVERSGQGRKTDPYVYHLTPEGCRVVEVSEALFPDLYNSA